MRHVTVRTLEEARSALAEGGPVRLDSPPGAALFHGVSWWLALLRLLDAEFPGAEYDAVLDCADAPGAALAAIRSGVKRIRLDSTVADKVADIARQAGVAVETP